ncbi:hypothetical protein JQ554_27015 [Bradyrhizobium diazoefficiens]|nr:hypothetical protein [Bradyrhizobium diazoefficiens]MBR0981290.1 hypothetical protein [Bradyrhizobium diazoefficiens]MBR1010744.1 hypothetical protein [Bradyrhizobium diazoefficiens]MBR1017255.1 hypothetical protein [Bradyrhizobium diazoefficiens]MBR1054503.1 hypothetical protein [Bradyrhizobium diazoefficiens]
MLAFLFGLNARLGRLQFLIASVALAIVMTAICFAIAMVMLGTTSPSMIRPEDLIRNWTIVAAMIVFGLGTFTLQSMRIRDIGWDPVCVVPAWLALMIVDHVVATRFPVWALQQAPQGTIVGALVNVVLMLALVLWPSADSDGTCVNPFERRSRAELPAMSNERLARAAQGAPRPTWR